MMLTCVLALSVHVLMLQAFHVPYPVGYPTTGWPNFCNLALSAFALMYFYDLSSDVFLRFSLSTRCLLLSVLVAMLREALIRHPVMDGFATTAWRYSFVDNLPRLLMVLLLCSLVVLLTPKLVRPRQRVLAALLVATIVEFLCRPVIAKVFEHILASIAYLNHGEVYKVPYGWQIEVPAYITYMEPVVACFLMAALVWDRLAKGVLARTLQFALLMMMINGSLLRPFVYVLYATFRPGVALLSMGQFSLEALALALPEYSDVETLSATRARSGVRTGDVAGERVLLHRRSTLASLPVRYRASPYPDPSWIWLGPSRLWPARSLPSLPASAACAGPSAGTCSLLRSSGLLRLAKCWSGSPESRARPARSGEFRRRPGGCWRG